MDTVDTLDGFRRTLVPVPERWAHPGEGRPETAGLVGGNPDAIYVHKLVMGRVHNPQKNILSEKWVMQKLQKI